MSVEVYDIIRELSTMRSQCVNALKLRRDTCVSLRRHAIHITEHVRSADAADDSSVLNNSYTHTAV